MAQSIKQGKDAVKRADAAFANQHYDQAVELYTQACHLLPDNVEPLLSLASAFVQVHSQSDALTVLEYAVHRFPNNMLASYQLAQLFTERGNFEKAIEKLTQITESDNANTLSAYAWLDIVRLTGKSLSTQEFDKSIQQLLQALDKSFSADEQTMVLNFALGQLFDAKQDYRNAQKYLIKANQMQLSSCSFRTADMQPFFMSIKTAFNQQMLVRSRSWHRAIQQEITPIFILGLPRTGSTLLEQMLIQHTKINSIGEQTYISEELAGFVQNQTNADFPEFAGLIDSNIALQGADIYLSCIAAHRLPGEFVINKLPANFQSIGLIKMIFPNAKIIEMRRNAHDVALSIFKNFFAENEPYFCDLAEFFKYNALYEELMTHWKSSIPDQICSIDYETLVNTPEQTLKDVITFCGLEWQDACLTDYDSGKNVTTLSAAQVRKALSTSSINAWKNYSELFS